MENCTIYTHQLAFDKIVRLVQTHLSKAKVEVKDGGLEKSISAKIKGGFWSKSKELIINYRQRKSPSYNLETIDCALSQNLSGMANFVHSLPAKNENLKSKFLYKIMAANAEFSFMASPSILPDFDRLLIELARELDAYIFANPSSFFNQADQQHFLDKNLELILDMQGRSSISDITVSIDSKYYDEPVSSYSQEQLDRKSQTENFLSLKGIKFNKHLPCVPSSEDLQLRSVQEVIERAYALLIISAKGEGVEQEHLERFVNDKNINGFTAQEKHIYSSSSLNDQERANATWRYESLYTLMWALGIEDSLKYPNDICDVASLVSKIHKPSRAEFEGMVKMRNREEILDELDKTYRMHWACVDARIKQEQVGGNLNSSVIYERHYALNWLSCYENLDWDDVETPT